jgi:hypothetical protein
MHFTMSAWLAFICVCVFFIVKEKQRLVLRRGDREDGIGPLQHTHRHLAIGQKSVW